MPSLFDLPKFNPQTMPIRGFMRNNPLQGGIQDRNTQNNMIASLLAPVLQGRMFSPQGDADAIRQGVQQRDWPTGLLGAASLALPGTIKPEMFGSLKISPDEVKNIIGKKQNYVTPLSKYSDTLFRETNADGAIDLLPFSNRTSTINDLHVSNAKDLALGQGKNKGFLIELDSGNLEGFLDMNKPGSDMALTSGMVEMKIRAPSQSGIRESVKSFLIKNDALTTKTEKMQIRRITSQAKKAGWVEESTDEGIRYIKPVTPEIN